MNIATLELMYFVESTSILIAFIAAMIALTLVCFKGVERNS